MGQAVPEAQAPYCHLDLRVLPHAARAGVVGWQDGVLKVKVMAPAEGGRANTAVMELIAGTLGLRPRCVSIETGQTARLKRIRVDGLSLDDARHRLETACKRGAQP